MAFGISLFPFPDRTWIWQQPYGFSYGVYLYFAFYPAVLFCKPLAPCFCKFIFDSDLERKIYFLLFKTPGGNSLTILNHLSFYLPFIPSCMGFLLNGFLMVLFQKSTYNLSSFLFSFVLLYVYLSFSPFSEKLVLYLDLSTIQNQGCIYLCIFSFYL